jgi:hypothetical protein
MSHIHTQTITHGHTGICTITQYLEHVDEHHGVCNSPHVCVLLVCHAKVDDDPADETRVHFTELLPVKHAGPAKAESTIEQAGWLDVQPCTGCVRV